MKRVIVLSLLLVFAAVRTLPALPPPAELPGPLVLTGLIPPKEAQDAFFTFAGKDKARIVLLIASTDADDVKRAESFLKEWTDREPESSSLLAIDAKKADDPKALESLSKATGVWLGCFSLKSTPPGRRFWGVQGLVDSFRGTLVEKELRKLHERGGVIGGLDVHRLGDFQIESPMEGKVELKPAFGILPGFIMESQHDIDQWNGRIKAAIAAKPDRIGIDKIPPYTALIIRGRQGRVVGEGSVELVVAKGAGKPAVSAHLNAGNILDLFQLRRSAANRTANNPFPPAKPKEPVVEKGSLVIVGGGGAGPEIWKKFIELAGGPDALIVFIPTALEDPIGFSFPEVSALQKFGAKKIHVLHTRDRAKADDPKFSEPLTRAGGVWFGGGRQWRFVEAYEDTLTEKRCHDVLARGGVIGGSSAGASIQSEYMPRGHPLGNTVMMAEGYEKGFGFLPGVAVDQHFFARKRTGDMTDLMKAYPQYLGIGIDEGTAIVVSGSRADVIGKTKVGFYDYRNGPPKGEKDYIEVETGSAFDLKTRQPIKTKMKAAG
jgi:cyanophycinase